MVRTTVPISSNRSALLSVAVLAALFLLRTDGYSADSLTLPPHPRLLLNSNGIAQLKARIAAAPWARAEWEELLQDANRALEKPVELPPRGGNWSHNYVCPEHGSRLSQGKKIGAWQWEHECPTGPHILRGDPTRATLDFDGNGISAEHARLASRSVNHGLVFQVTGNAAHAQCAREILLAYASRYKTYPLHDNQGKPGRGARIASQPLTEASWLIEMAQGADLVWTTFSDAERNRLKGELFMPALEEVIFNRKPSIHNIQCRINSAIGLTGFLLGDAQLIDRALNDPGSGYHQQMAEGVMPDGMWYEGSSGYHFFTIAGLWTLTEAARNCGINLYGPALQSMFDAPLVFALPDLRMPDFNDSGMMSLARQSPDYELAFARYGKLNYVPLIKLGNRRNRMAMLFGELNLPTGLPPELKSRNYPDSGYAILQQGKGQDALWLCLKYGPHGGGHGHPDKNHFLLYVRGQVLAPDGGTHAYGSKLHSGWDKATAAHNTLVVNGTNQLTAQGRSLAFGSEQGVDYSMTEAGPIYRGVKFVRTAVVLSSNLVLFVDQVQADEPVTMDLHYHHLGEWKALPPGETWSAPEAPAYRYMQRATVRAANPNGLELKTSVTPDWQTSLALAGSEAGEIITGYGILKTTEDQVPWLIQRRRAKSTAFVWALALDGRAAPIRVTDVQSAGARLERAEAVCVRVQDGTDAWELLINPQEKPVSIGGAQPWHTKAPIAIRAQR